ncbi:MAG: hypothetical protein GY811_23715, partial [Myxococcales bacterium]|nr:hypothetical protein [Myxococcales bacterium]
MLTRSFVDPVGAVSFITGELQWPREGDAVFLMKFGIGTFQHGVEHRGVVCLA